MHHGGMVILQVFLLISVMYRKIEKMFNLIVADQEQKRDR